jgi:hypothetical protein
VAGDTRRSCGGISRRVEGTEMTEATGPELCRLRQGSRPVAALRV